MVHRNTSHPSTIVPPDVLPKFKAIIALTDAFCREHLNQEYAKMCRRLTVALARKQRVLSLEGKVVQDADRLDAIGAIGVARAFAYGAVKGRLIHDPEVHPAEHQTFEAYLKGGGTTINHFYEKLLLLKDRMNTATGRTIAEERHQFMEEYLRRFLEEWDGG